MQIKVGRGRGGKQSCQQAAGAHLGVSQCAFQRLNFSIISDFYSRNTKRQQIAPLVNIWTTKRKLKNKFHTVLVFLSDAVTGRCHFQHKGIRWGRHCVVLFSTGKKKRQCCVEACCEMTGSSLSLTEAGKNVKTSTPNPLRKRRRISTCKNDWHCLKRGFPGFSKRRLTKNNWCSHELIITGVGLRISGFANF